MSRFSAVHVSEAEFLELPESPEKVELVDGEIVVTPAPNVAHQMIVVRLVGALVAWAKGRKPRVMVGCAPLGVRIGAERILQPDVFVSFEDSEIAERRVLDRVPELCVEVLSTNRSHDRTTKRYLYAEAGVRESWVIDPAGVVERWDGPSLARYAVVEGALRSPLLPGFEIELAGLFDPRSGIA